MLDNNLKQALKLGLIQIPSDGLQRIINHEGDMLLNGEIYSRSRQCG